MIRALGIACAVLVAAAALLGWLLLDAHESLGAERMAHAVSKATLATLEANEARNAEIDKKIEGAIQKTAATTREVFRAIATSENTGACAQSPAVRALDGLRRSGGGQGGGQAAPATPAKPVPAPGR